MNNPFLGIINQDLKNTFNNAIDALIAENSLSVPCKIRYNSAKTQRVLCNNCIFDTISLLSSNRFNDTGPQPFAENTICPVCLGRGTIDSLNNEEIIHLAVIFDSKYFINYNSKAVNIPAGSVQTLSKIDTISKLRNADEIIFDTKIENYGLYAYQRASDPEPCGFSDHRYIITLWSRK